MLRAMTAVMLPLLAAACAATPTPDLSPLSRSADPDAAAPAAPPPPVIAGWTPGGMREPAPWRVLNEGQSPRKETP